MRSQPAQILLIDDRPEIESALAACLRKDQIQLTGVRDGRSGLELAEEKKFDLILLDLEMPEMDGFEVLQRLKNSEATRPVPVIMLTGYDTLPDKVRSFELGASDYIVKPFQAAELRARIRAVLRTQQLNSMLSQAEQELSECQHALAEARSAKDRVVGMVNCGLRAPLAGNQALAGVLLQCGLNEHQRELVTTIAENSGATLDVLRDIADFSLLQNGQMKLEREAFDLRICVEDVLSGLSAKAGAKNLNLVYLWPDDLPAKVLGDSRRIRQLIAHLLDNAIRCTPRGEVTLRVGLAGMPGEAAARGPDLPGALCTFHFLVKDTGVGIPATMLEHLFTPLAPDSKNDTSHATGSGLGLAICRGLASLHGGGLWAESTPGEGSVFHFTLPLHLDLEAGHSNRTPANPKLAGKSLLVADESAVVCESVCQQARALGLAVAAAHSAQAVRDYVAQGKPCDLLLLDASLPGGGGIALSRDLHREGLAADRRVVLLTRPGRKVALESLNEGRVAAALAKPTRISALQEACLEAFDGTRFVEEPPRPALLDPTLASRLPVRILVVDGNPVTQTILASILHGNGYVFEKHERAPRRAKRWIARNPTAWFF